MPAGHLLHESGDSAGLVSEYLPASQNLQSEERLLPVFSKYLPFSQILQSSTEDFDGSSPYLPFGQSLQSMSMTGFSYVDLSSEYNPAKQSLHSEDNSAPSLAPNFPGKHGLQAAIATDRSFSRKNPVGHLRQ